MLKMVADFSSRTKFVLIPIYQRLRRNPVTKWLHFRGVSTRFRLSSFDNQNKPFFVIDITGLIESVLRFTSLFFSEYQLTNTVN